ncbi:MAG: hypothetical protein ACFFD3_13550 [Candidatus Thorarchaeota archaeon]
MNKAGFRKFLQERKMPDEKIDDSIKIVEDFESFLENDHGMTPESASSVQALSFIDTMVENEKNSYGNFVALMRYGYFIGNNDLYISFLEPIDGSEVLNVLHDKLGESVGEELRDEVFKGIDFPPLGTPSSEKPRIAKRVMDRMETLVDGTTCEKTLTEVAHGLPKEYYNAGQREKFLAARDLDEYLEQKRNAFIAQLEKHRDEGTPFFNQEITDDVVQWIRSNPGIGSEKREDAFLIHTKIPYLTKEYLVETDERMKRYYACHCAWAREAIKTGEDEVSPTFCYCSGGYAKRPWEFAFDQPLEIEMLESALKGDERCTFRIPIPKDVLEKIQQV